MTVTPPGTPARRRAPRVAAAILAILAVIAPAASAGAATPTPTPTPTPTLPVLSGETSFTLAPVANGILRPGEALSLSLTVQNGTASATPALAVSVSLGRSALADRTALTAWLGGSTSGAPTQQIATTTIEPVASGSQSVTAVRVDPADPVLAGRAPGVYPLVASYISADGVVASTSAVIIPPADDREVGIGVVVPITAGALAEGLLTAEQLTELTGPEGALSAQLDGVEGSSAILAVDPAILAAIRVLGTTAPVSATAWLERLDALPNSRFALQFGDADVALQLQTGLPRPLEPLSLAYAMTPEDFVPARERTPSPTPSESTDPNAPAIPDVETLVRVDGSRPAVYWPAAGTAGPDVVATLGQAGTEDQSSLTLVSSASTAAGATGGTVPAHARMGEADVLVYDADVSAALHEASLREESVLRAAPLAAATAYLAFASAESRGSPLLVTLGRDPDRSRVALGSTIAAATQAPNVVASSLGGLTSSPPVTLTVLDAAPDDARVAEASRLLSEEADISRFATILEDMTLLTGPERAEILQLFGVAWRADGAGWTTAVAAHRVATQTTLDSVGLLPTSTINLFGSGAGLRFWVRNDLPYPVSLVLYASPDDLRLDVQRANPLVATASSNTRVEVPVQARVGNGEVILALQLRSRASVAIGDPENVEVNVRAEWENVGIAALSVVVGGLLILGAARTVLRLRARRTHPDDDSAAETAETGVPVGEDRPEESR